MLENMEQSTYTMCLLAVALFELMQITSAQYPFVEAYKEIQIGFPVQSISKSKMQLLYFADVDAMFYFPLVKNCEQWALQFRYFRIINRRRGDLYTYSRKFKCIYAGMNRYIIQRLGTYMSDGTEFSMVMNIPIEINIYTGGESVPTNYKHIYTITMVHHNRTKKLPMVPWHYVAGTGPGWIDLRFSVPHTHPNTLCTYLISHWRHNDGRDPQVAYSPESPNMYIDFKELMPRAKPTLPCPQWKTYDIYCTVLTSFINPLHFSGMDFTDYSVRIITTGLKHLLSPSPDNMTYNQMDTVLWGFDSNPVIFVVRAWENYDMTSGEGPEILRSIPFHQEWTKEPILKEIWGSNISESIDDDATTISYGSTSGGLESRDPHAEYSDALIMDENMGQYKTIWPFLLFFVLILLLIVLPLVMFVNKRTCVKKEMSKWEHWKSGKEDVVFAARPGPVPAARLDPA